MVDVIVILPSVCDVCLHVCWVSLGARKPNCHYHFFIQTRPAMIMSMTMMITMVPVMVSAMVDLRVIPPSVCGVCSHSCWVSVGVVITISSFKQSPPCKERTWLHHTPTCSSVFSMGFYVFPLSPFSSSFVCRLRATLLVVTRSTFLVINFPLSRKFLENPPPRLRATLLVVTRSTFLLIILSLPRNFLENPPPRKILQGGCCFSALNII